MINNNLSTLKKKKKIVEITLDRFTKLRDFALFFFNCNSHIIIFGFGKSGEISIINLFNYGYLYIYLHVFFQN